MDVVSLALAKGYANEQLNKLPQNGPTKKITFDGGVYSVGPDVVNGQVSDVVIKGVTRQNLVKNGNGENSTNDWSIEGTGFTWDATEKAFKLLSDSSTVRIQQPVKLQGGKQYIVSVKHKSLVYDSPRLIIENPDGAYLMSVALDNNTSYGVQSNSFSPPIDGEYKITFVLYLETSTIFLKEILLEEGSEIKSYISGDGTKSTNSVRVKSVGVNLLNERLINYSNPNFVELLPDGTISFKSSSEPGGLGTQIGIITLKSDSATRTEAELKKLIKVKEGYRYYFRCLEPSRVNNIFSAVILGEDGKYVKKHYGISSGGSIVIASGIGAKYLELNRQSSAFTCKGIIISEEIDHSYEPYKESSITTPEVGGSVGTAKDEVNVGLGQKIQRIKKYILQASDISALNTHLEDIDRVILTGVLPNANKTDWSISELCQSVIIDGFTAKAFPHGVSDAAYRFYGSLNADLVLCVPKGTYINLAAAQAALAGTTLIYQLAQPIITKLPAQPPLQVYENGTVYVEPIGDSAESTLPTTELAIPIGTSNKFGVASHDYDGAAADWALTNNESKCFLLAVSNAGGAANIIAPDAPGVMYAISNASGYTITIKISGGTGVAITNAKTVLVIHNGTDYTALTAEL